MTDQAAEPQASPPTTRRHRARVQTPPEPVAQEKPPESAQGKPEPGQASTGVQLEFLAGVANSATRIVQKASSILEEELAVGIGATQRIERKLIDVNKIRADDPQEVIMRFRRDAHDVVDILIDLVNVATNALDDISQRVVKIGIGGTTGEKKAPGGGTGSSGIPSLAVPTPVKAGTSIDIPMTLENASSKPTEAFYLLSSDLINPSGERIKAQQISFKPDKLVIEPQNSTIVTIRVSVPEQTPPGVYSGLLQATRLEQLRAVLSIQIE